MAHDSPPSCSDVHKVKLSRNSCMMSVESLYESSATLSSSAIASSKAVRAILPHQDSAAPHIGTPRSLMQGQGGSGVSQPNPSQRHFARPDKPDVRSLPPWIFCHRL